MNSKTCSSTNHSQLLSSITFGDRNLLVKTASSGVNPSNVLDENGDSLLHLASKRGHLDIVRTLVEVYHCNPDLVNSNCATPWHIACQNCHISVLPYLLSMTSAQVDHILRYSDNEGESLLHKACRKVFCTLFTKNFTLTLVLS